MEYIILEQALSYVISDFSLKSMTDMPMQDMMGWAIRAIRFIGSTASIEETKREIQIENFTGKFPLDLSAPIRVLGHKMNTNIAGTGFKTDVMRGPVTLVYHKFVVDDRGYPMVPKDESMLAAIGWFIAHKLSLAGTLPNKQLGVDYCDSQWQWYCGQSRAEGFVPTLDAWERMVNVSHRMLPPRDSYDNEFVESEYDERDYLKLDSINANNDSSGL